MKTRLLTLFLIILFSNFSYAKLVQQTICFSQKDYAGFPMAYLGDYVTLNGGKCQGKTLIEMNRAGWKIIQVVGNLSNSFGVILEKQ